MVKFSLSQVGISLFTLLVMSGCSSLTQDSLVDEYDYMPSPLAKQHADLNDKDSDGVINARDLCSSTNIGTKINNDGCGKELNKEEKKQLHILFANNSSVINPIFSGQIKEMAAFLATYPSTSIQVNGYTSKLGTEKSNQILSEQRAEAVKNSLINYGVEPNRIKSIGHGESEPAIDEDSEFAATKNRRVTATVINHDNVIEKQWTIFSKIPRNASSY